MVLAFDLDGTLFDNSDILVPSLRDAVKDFSEETGILCDVPSKETVQGVIGFPMIEIFRGIMPGLDDSYAAHFIELFMDELVGRINQGGGRIYDGIAELLHRLYDDSYTLIVASNGTKKYIEAVLSYYSIGPLFSQPLYIVDEKKIHTKTALVKEYRMFFGKEPMIMIGDRVTDRDAAAENDIPFINCVYGHADDDELTGSHTAESAADIYTQIKLIETEKAV